MHAAICANTVFAIHVNADEFRAIVVSLVECRAAKNRAFRVFETGQDGPLGKIKFRLPASVQRESRDEERPSKAESLWRYVKRKARRGVPAVLDIERTKTIRTLGAATEFITLRGTTTVVRRPNACR